MIESIEVLRRVYSEAKGRAVRKQIDHIDVHCARFVALSPFVVIASVDAQGALDASPRGGVPGFVRVADAHTLLIADCKQARRKFERWHSSGPPMRW